MKISNKIARFSLILNGVFILLFIALLVFAVVQRMEAVNSKVIAEQCRNELSVQREIAEEQERIAIEQRNEAIRQAERAKQKAEEARLEQD